jgi:hypothetical protein
VRPPSVEPTNQAELVVNLEDGDSVQVVRPRVEQLDTVEARGRATHPEALARLEVTRRLAPDLDAVDFVAALIEARQHELLEEPGSDGDGKPEAGDECTGRISPKRGPCCSLTIMRSDAAIRSEHPRARAL